MNSEDPTSDPALSALLRQSKASTPLPPGFQDAVWRRIDRAQTAEPAWLTLFRQIIRALARPALAAGYVTTLLAMGLGAGYWQARLANAHADALLSSRYVQLIDPYQMPRH